MQLLRNHVGGGYGCRKVSGYVGQQGGTGNTGSTGVTGDTGLSGAFYLVYLSGRCEATYSIAI